MKPTLDLTRASKREDVTAPVSKRFPVTDFNYQSIVLDDYRGGCASKLAPSFLNISNDYFKNEARHEFAGEAAFFAAIVITTALPVLYSVHLLADFIRATAF